jgi:EAL domain-containing protein (putative c-di-GMP-specific phosphodiesterase class I)
MNDQTALNRCTACRQGAGELFPFSMAFQPIVDVGKGTVYAYEALARGSRDDSAATVLSQVNAENRYAFDQTCRFKAISLAAGLGLAKTSAKLSINFLPGAVFNPAACIQLTLTTARSFNFPCEQLIFEIVENEAELDVPHLRSIVKDYRQRGFKVAFDDFGAGHAGLNLLADFPTDIIKLDMALTRNLHRRPAALAIVKAMAGLAGTLGSDLIAEGVETVDEYATLCDCGVSLMQGYLFAKPAYEALPDITLPRLRRAESRQFRAG